MATFETIYYIDMILIFVDVVLKLLIFIMNIEIK